MIFIFLLALILFGPKRLPEIAREVGKFMAEFKRASNDFKYQLQAEIDKASVPTAPSSTQAAQQTPASTGVVLPPSAPAPAQAPAEDAETEHQRLMRTARMAFEAQNFTLRPPEPPPIAHASPQTAAEQTSPGESAPAQPATEAAPASDSAVQRS